MTVPADIIDISEKILIRVIFNEFMNFIRRLNRENFYLSN